MAGDVKVAKCAAKDSVRKTSELSAIMSKRLQRLKDLKFIVCELKEALVDESHL